MAVKHSERKSKMHLKEITNNKHFPIYNNNPQALSTLNGFMKIRVKNKQTQNAEYLKRVINAFTDSSLAILTTRTTRTVKSDS